MRQSASVLVLGLAMTLVVLVGGIDLSVGSVVLASATLAGIVLAEGLPPAARHAVRRSASAPPSALLNAALVEGLRISPGDRHARHDDRRPRPQPRRARALQFLGRDQGADLRRPRAARPILGIPLDALVALALAGPRLVRPRLAPPSAARWHAAGDAPVAARLAGLRVGALRGARLCRLRRAGRRRRRPGRGAHRPDQPLDRPGPRVLRHRRRRARRRRPAGRPGHGLARSSSAR